MKDFTLFCTNCNLVASDITARMLFDAQYQ